MNAMFPTVHIVDDDAACSKAISRLLKASHYEVVVYASATELLEAMTLEGRGCILLDMQLPDLDGLEVQKRLSDLGSSLPIVFLTGYGNISSSVRAIKAGAEDFLSKPVQKHELLEAINRSLVRCEEAQERNALLQSLRAMFAKLTPREREVFSWVVRGKINKQIAHEMGTSERTIKSHRHACMAKLQVKSVAELVLIARRLGMELMDSAPGTKALPG
jgi:RNA polymerase sigma factor (sigma-70 family)